MIKTLRTGSLALLALLCAFHTAHADPAGGFQLPVSNSIKRAQDAKMSDYVSLRDVGGICDGSTSDNAAINSVLAYAQANGAPIIFDGNATSGSCVNTVANIGTTARGTVLWPGYTSAGVITNTSAGLFVSTAVLPVAQGGTGSATALIKTQRFGVTCTTGATIGALCTSAALTWTAAFADANYTLTCTLGTVTGQPHIVNYGSKLAASFTLSIAADTAVAASAAADCIAVHD